MPRRFVGDDLVPILGSNVGDTAEHRYADVVVQDVEGPKAYRQRFSRHLHVAVVGHIRGAVSQAPPPPEFGVCVSRTASSLMSTATTFAPSRANASAAALPFPMPDRSTLHPSPGRLSRRVSHPPGSLVTDMHSRSSRTGLGGPARDPQGRPRSQGRNFVKRAPHPLLIDLRDVPVLDIEHQERVDPLQQVDVAARHTGAVPELQDRELLFIIPVRKALVDGLRDRRRRDEAVGLSGDERRRRGGIVVKPQDLRLLSGRCCSARPRRPIPGSLRSSCRRDPA